MSLGKPPNEKAQPQKATVTFESSTETPTPQAGKTVALFVGWSAWL